VALKLMKKELAVGDEAERRRVRLLREAHALALISHPNVVRVFDTGAIEGRVYIAMELLDGGSLREWLRGRPRSMQEVLAVFSAAGQGLAAAHDMGLVHRDFKPGNVLVSREGRVVVTDFGLVRLAGVEVPATGQLPAILENPDSGLLGVPLTLPGAVLGTPG